MADYVLHCFAQSGNAYKPALDARARGRRLDAALRRLFRRRDAHAGLSRDQRDGRSAGARASASSALSQSGVILDYLAESLGKFGPRDDDERREVLRWLLFDNHKLTSYTATYRFMRTFAQGPGRRGAGGVSQARRDGVGHSRRASRRPPLRRRRSADDRRPLACAVTCSGPRRSASTGTRYPNLRDWLARIARHAGLGASVRADARTSAPPA